MKGCTRRQMLAGLALPLAVPFAAHGAAEPFPSRPTLLVAGPAGGALDQAARVICRGLVAHLPAGTMLARTPVGGLDGVTGANLFTTDTSPDGGSALLVPGAASMAWLAGDSRVHFDPSRWLPIMARTTPGFVVTAGRPIRPGQQVRVASGGPVSPELAAMLAVDLLGAQVWPVFGLGESADAVAALASGHVDAVFLRGAARLESATATNPMLRPLFTLGTPAGSGAYQRATLAPQVPTLVEYGVRLGRVAARGPKFEAWACAASAAQLQYALVLPGLTPSSDVALWRDAASQALAPDLISSVNIVYASAASVLLRTLCPGGAALLEVRTWLSDRLGWQPT